MKDSIFNKRDLLTPAYVYDQVAIVEVLNVLASLEERTGCQSLYSIKSANITGLLNIIKPYVTGFSCSSLFELKLAKEILNKGQSIHITTPGYRNDEWGEVIELSDYVTLNSISQWERLAKQISHKASCGIRINPELSFVKDDRYNPCRENSKLGITFNQLEKATEEQRLDWSVIEGIHIHNNCESTRFDELKQSIEKVMSGISVYEANLKWINLGGGYLFNKDIDLTLLEETIHWLKERFNVEVFIEPGKAVTGKSGYLVSSVIDIIEQEEKKIAVLDTSINHLPEVFEYQYQPLVMNSLKKSEYEYRLVGCSCLSGDLFGDYFFDNELEIGSRIVFVNIGAYMQVKANMFNGINLPATYLLDCNKKFKLLKQYDFQSFLSRI